MPTISKLTQLTAVLLLATFVSACAGSRSQESTGEYLDDTMITSKVKTKLLQDKDVGGLAINVETFKAVVQLSGFAKTEAERQKAAQLAREVGGVKDVKNDIRLKSGG
jgi:osmotically-inducible protein OsmY